MNIPTELIAGDSATWEDVETVDRLGAAINSTWTLKYVLSFPTAVTLTATTNGSGWSTTLSKTASAVAAGDYYWQAYAELDTRRETIGTGRLTIKPAAGSAISGKSQTALDLDAVQTAIRAMINGGAVQEYTIGGRSLRKIALADLLVLESKLKTRLAYEKKAERIANGLGNPSNIYTRFNK